MGDPLFGRAWNTQVLTPPDNAGQQTLLEVSSSDKETSSLLIAILPLRSLARCSFRGRRP
jgi:hypothetical protein